MENRREVKENDTLLEMDNLNLNNDVGHVVVVKRPHAETNRLAEDVTADEHFDNENTNALEGDNGDDDSSSSSSEEDEHSHEIDPNSCKGKIAHVMKSNVMQYSVITMVIADCLIIVLELLIDLDFIQLDKPDAKHDQSHHSMDDSWNITTHQPGHDIYLDHSLSWHNSSHHNSSGHTTHGEHHHTNKEKAEHILHACSLTILSLFMIEVSLKIYVEGKHLLRQKAEVFDAVVVIVSFTLDIVFSFVSVESAAKDAAGLMVILRLWRVTRIINGVILSVQIEAKKKSDALKKIIRQLEHENKKQRSRIDKLEKENIFLRQQLTGPNDSSTGRVLLPSKVSYHHHHHHPESEDNHKERHGHKDKDDGDQKDSHTDHHISKDNNLNSPEIEKENQKSS